MRLRTTPSALVLVCLLPFTACGSSSSDTGGTPSPPGGDGGVSSEGGGLPGSDGGGGDASAGGATIQGTLLSRSDHHVVASRAMTLRDSKGNVRSATTDAAGAFTVSDVTPPYDVYVAPSGTSSNATSTVYLGVHATKLRIFGDTNDLPAPAAKNATASLSWVTPTCTGGACKVFIVVHTAGGTDSRALHPGYGSGTSHTFNVQVDWPEPDTTTSAQASLLLSGTDGGSHFFATAPITLTAGQTAALTFTPQSVAPLGTATLTATSTATAFNPPGGLVRLALPAPGGAFEIASGSMPSPLSFFLPTIAGSSLTLISTQLSSGAPFNSVGATQIGVAPAAMAYSVPLGDPYPIASPAEKGSVSVGSGSVEFRSGNEPRTHVVQWVRLDSGPGTYVVLADPKLTLSRLAGLGPAITAGPIQLIVEEHTRAMDDWLGDMVADTNDRWSSTSYEASFTP